MNCGLGNNRALVLLAGAVLLLAANARADEMPRPADIRSGKALDELLRKFKDIRVPDFPEPPLPLPPKVRAAINVRTPSGIDAAFFLKPRAIPWPMALDQAKEKAQVVAGFTEITRQALKGKVSPKTVKELKGATSRLAAQLNNVIEEISPSQYIEAKRFLNRVEKAAQGATLAKLSAELKLASEVAVKGTSVPDLVRIMTTNKMTFAPALEGSGTLVPQLRRGPRLVGQDDEQVAVPYQELHKAMLEYYRKASKAAK